MTDGRRSGAELALVELSRRLDEAAIAGAVGSLRLSLSDSATDHQRQVRLEAIRILESARDRFTGVELILWLLDGAPAA